MDLPGHAARIAEEARALLTADECPALDSTDLILGSEQMALQIHESVGHAIELDRILGWEAAFAGTSWLDLDEARIAAVRLGADEHHRRSRRFPVPWAASASTTRGRPRTRSTSFATGIWVGALSGRDSAALAGLDRSGGAVRADGFNRIPMVRMTNVGLLPGSDSTESMIAATDDGVFMDTNRSWSIDDKRLNFQFGCEIGWEIKNGKRGRLLRNPTYTAISPRFWGAMDMLGGQRRVDVLGHAELRQGPAAPGRPHRAPGGAGTLPRDPGGGARDDHRDGRRTSTAHGRGSGRPDAVAERVLELVRARVSGAEAEVTVERGTAALTRFANSFIHQNVAEETSHIVLRVAVDGRTATARLDGPPNGDALERLVGGALESARVRPVDPDWPGVAPVAAAPGRRPLGRGDGRGHARRSGPDRGGLRRRGRRARDRRRVLDERHSRRVCEQRRAAASRPIDPRIARRHRPDRLVGRQRPAVVRRRSPRSTVGGRRTGRAQGSRQSRTRPTSSRAATRWSSSRSASRTCSSSSSSTASTAGPVEEGRSFVRLGEAQFDRAITMRDDVDGPGDGRAGLRRRGDAEAAHRRRARRTSRRPCSTRGARRARPGPRAPANAVEER